MQIFAMVYSYILGHRQHAMPPAVTGGAFSTGFSDGFDIT